MRLCFLHLLPMVPDGAQIRFRDKSWVSDICGAQAREIMQTMMELEILGLQRKARFHWKT